MKISKMFYLIAWILLGFSLSLSAMLIGDEAAIEESSSTEDDSATEDAIEDECYSVKTCDNRFMFQVEAVGGVLCIFEKRGSDLVPSSYVSVVHCDYLKSVHEIWYCQSIDIKVYAQ